MSLRILLPILFPLVVLHGASFGQQSSPRQDRMMGVEQMLIDRGDETLRSFVAEHLALTYVESFGNDDAVLEHLRSLRQAVAPVDDVGIMIEDGRVSLHIANRERESVVSFELEEAAPYRIVTLVLDSSEVRERGSALSWDSLESALLVAEAAGFCGSILAVHDGEIVLDRGFGFSDPARENPVTPTTLFAIGSTPIDFTHGAILKLEEAGTLSLGDPLSRWFEDVPQDKRDITLDQLRTGRSGLLDFPGIEGVDENLDLSWLDREMFLGRVWTSELLFEPGTNERHSHVAWGVLAAAWSPHRGTCCAGASSC